MCLYAPRPILLCVSFALLLVRSALADFQVIEQDATLSASLPAEAWKGSGAWKQGSLLVATGRSSSVDALGEAKGRAIEEKAAAEDARKRLLLSTLSEDERELFDVIGELSEARTAALYRLEARGDLHVIMVVPENRVKVEKALNAQRGKARALVLLNAGDVEAAARLLARLTELGVQDKETLDHARAASARVNLIKGVKGAPEREAWAVLGGYHERHGTLDDALKAWHQVYLLEPKPSRALLEKLASLSAQTHRPQNAIDFQNELLKRWPDSSSKR